MAESGSEMRANGAELIASLRAVLAALESVNRPPAPSETGKVRKTLQLLDSLIATAGALRGGELPAESFARLSTARRSLNQVFVAPKYVRAAETTLRQVLTAWEAHWPAGSKESQ